MKTITLTDKDFGPVTLESHQITKIEFHLPDRLGISVTVVNVDLKDLESGRPIKFSGKFEIVPVEPKEIKEMFRVLSL